MPLFFQKTFSILIQMIPVLVMVLLIPVIQDDFVLLAAYG